MARYLCQICYRIVTYGENHPCLFYKNDDKVYSLPQLEESDKMNKTNDDTKLITKEYSNDNYREQYPEIRQNNCEEYEQMKSSLNENNHKFSFKPALKGNIFSETASNSSLNVQENKDHPEANASVKASSEKENEPCCRSEICFHRAYNRTPVNTGAVYEQKKCGSKISAAEECETSLQESNWKSFNNDTDVFWDSSECAIKDDLLEKKNIPRAKNSLLNYDFSLGNMEKKSNGIETSDDLREKQISLEMTSVDTSTSDKMAANMEEPILSIKDDDVVAGPSGSSSRKKKWICDICFREFKYESLLTRHYCKHTGEKSYVCEICGNKFSRKETLNDHYRVHTGERPYKCRDCEKTFKRSSNRSLHYRTKHQRNQSGN